MFSHIRLFAGSYDYSGFLFKSKRTNRKEMNVSTKNTHALVALLLLSVVSVAFLAQAAKAPRGGERIIAGQGVENPLPTEWRDLKAKPQPDEAVKFNIALK